MTPVVTSPSHTPVLLDRVVELFGDAPEGVLVDATVGAGGHSEALVRDRRRRGAEVHLLGLDRDPVALGLADERLRGHADDPAVRIELVRTRFDALEEVLDARGIGGIAGILLDLGISSMHVDDPARGFSYRREGPLDMRMDPRGEVQASDLVNDLPARELAVLLRRYGDERFADRIARAVVEARPLSSTTQLAEVVRSAIPAAARRSGGHPATRTFQALRIAVNGELDALAQVLPTAIGRLLPGGIAVVLSYHSLEDRMVKRAFVGAARGCVCPPDLPVCACGRSPLVTVLTRRPERPDATECATNPRATAARLRAVRRLPENDS